MADIKWILLTLANSGSCYQAVTVVMMLAVALVDVSCKLALADGRLKDCQILASY